MRVDVGCMCPWRYGWTLLHWFGGERDYRGVWSGTLAVLGLVIEWEIL